MSDDAAGVAPRQAASVGELLRYQEIVAFHARLERRRRIAYWLLVPWGLACVGLAVGMWRLPTGTPDERVTFGIIAASYTLMVIVQWVPSTVITGVLERGERRRQSAVMDRWGRRLDGVDR